MRQISEPRLAALAELTVSDLAMPNAADNQPKGLSTYKHWRLVMDKDNILWVLIDKDNESANTLAEPVLRELDKLLDEAKTVGPKALVLRSAKTSGFIAGAEISEFVNMTDENEVRAQLTDALTILDKLENFPAPTIALLHKYCLGGGLELALACKYRIATPDTKLGFPEVLLGLHPGLAGVWRSLRIMDPVNAMTMMLTGKNLIAKKAKRQGLVDLVTEERHFADAVRAAANGKLKKTDAKGTKGTVLNFGPARSLVASQMEKQTASKAKKQHYPAPFSLIDIWREHGDDAQAMRKAETDSFVKLMVGDTSKNLVRAFFLREKLKAYSKGTVHNIKHVHVIGAGVMGGDIAAWSAMRGFTVTLQDREIKYIAPAIKRANELFKKRIYTEGERRAANDRLMPDVKGDGITKADLIIEVVPENPDIKASVYADCEKRMKPGAILATNTSSILLETLTKTLKNPKRFCGIHFFNPVAKMPLVEIITHDKLDPKVTKRVLGFLNAIDKLPLPVKSAPGFLVNRALTPYMVEAFLAYSEGVKPELIDKVMEDFGMPMGPIELADTVGLDVGLHVAKVLQRDLKRETPDAPDWLEKLVEKGDLGKKTGKGIYKWVNGKAKKQKTDDQPPVGLTDRLILPLLNAVADCMAEDLIEDNDAADAGMIFGTGFAPFTGGPINYAKKRGVDEIVEKLQALEGKYGARFAVSKGWEKLK